MPASLHEQRQSPIAEILVRLIDLAKNVRHAQKHGEELGLISEETAFYDALAENGSAREDLKNETLRLMHGN